MKKMKKLLAVTMALMMVLSLGMTVSAAEGEESGDGEEKVIHYWAQWSEDETQATVLKDAIARFEDSHPGVTVDVNWAGREVRDILRTSLDAGIEIDIIESSYATIVESVGEGYLMDLTPYMEGTDFEASILPSMTSFAKSFASDGESWYYIPAQPFVGTIYYNKAIFDEAGITEEPATWDEFLDCCQKIKDAGYDPLTFDDVYSMELYGTYLCLMKGPDWTTEFALDKTGSMLDDPAVLQMAQDFQELYDKGYFSATCGSNVFPAAQNSELALGTAAMYYNGSWLQNEVANITGDDFEWGAMYFPAPDGSTFPYTSYSTGCQFYAVPKDCKNPEEAVALLEEFTSVQTQQDLVDKAQCMPVIDGIELPENLQCVQHLLDTSTDVIPWNGCNTYDSDVQTYLNSAFLELCSGIVDADGFIAELKSELK